MRVAIIAILAVLLAVPLACAQKAAAARRPAPGAPPIGAAEQAEMAPLIDRARRAMAAQKYADAADAWQQIVKIQPRIAEFQSNLGLAEYLAGRPRDAIEPLRTALKLNTHLEAPRYFLAVSLAESGACREALGMLAKEMPRVKDRGLKRTMGLDAARCAIAQGDADNSVTFVRALQRDFGNDPDVLYLAAHVYSDLSTEASSRLLKTAPDSWQAHRFNAEVLELQGKTKEAIEEYRRVIEINPTEPGLHYQIGQLILQSDLSTRGTEQAQREFEAELKVFPGYPAAEYQLGEIARRARRWDEAISHFNNAIGSDPQLTEAYLALAKTQEAAGRDADALQSLERGAGKNRDNADIHYQLAASYRRAGRQQDAEKQMAIYRAIHDRQEKQEQAIRKAMQGLDQPARP